MVKYAETRVVCPFSINGRPKTAFIRYIEENGSVLISAPNGCDDMSGADVCHKCMQTLHKDFVNGGLKDTYYFS
jgi:hypothetical protein